MQEIDQTWLPFTNLMLNHVFNILMICSDYDRFLINGDGKIEEQLFFEYTQLGLSNPPKITYSSTGEESIEKLESRNFELVIIMLEKDPNIGQNLAEKIKKKFNEIPILVLSPTPSIKKNQKIKNITKSSSIDYLFYWQGNPNIFLAMTKLIEDKINIFPDTQEADIQAILLIEDSVRYYSSYLPKIYSILISQNRESITEALNVWGKTLRMRGRPKILLATNYEEAEEFYNKYKNNLLGIISDVQFKINGKESDRAGFKLLEQVEKEKKDIPFLFQTSIYDIKKDIEKYSNHMKVAYLEKNDLSFFEHLETYMQENYGFGPLLFKDKKTGEVIKTINTMKELQHQLPNLPEESFCYHLARNDFSKWLRARSLFKLASKVKPYQLKKGQDPKSLQIELSKIIQEYRANRNKGVIAEFSKDNYDEMSFFTRLGSGSLGGKGRGLAFIDFQINASHLAEKYPNYYFSIPRTVVICTDFFSDFLKKNKINRLDLLKKTDKSILKYFLEKPLPKELENDLKEILEVIIKPISVRSSSLLEDSHFQPFAGIYETCMLSNLGSPEKRLKELKDAIRTVYASTFFSRSQSYLKSTGHIAEEEKMAIVVQQITGSRHGEYWYPNIGGVAKSINYYPFPGEKANAGIGMLTFGFGKSIVDNGESFKFSPTHPKRNYPSKTQDFFYALNLEAPFEPLKGNLDNLELLPIEKAFEYPDGVRNIVSTFDSTTFQLSEDPNSEGIKQITYNGILKYDTFPLADMVKNILDLGTKSMKVPIEIEFAINLNRDYPKKPEFSVLQIRPIIEGFEDDDIEISKEEERKAIVFSRKTLGNGTNLGIKDIITFIPSNYNRLKHHEMVEELNYFNKKAIEGHFSYVVLTPGRLGSSDPFLGIPCNWNQISQVEMIIETGLEDFQVEPSQGSHFFQNLTSQGVIYFSINPLQKDGRCDYDFFEKTKAEESLNYFKHIKLKENLTIKVDGKNNKGIILL